MGSSFAKVLKQIRTEKDISQKTLAQKLFVTRSAVSYWENGSRVPDAEMIVRIAECLDIDASLLLNAVLYNDITPNVIMVDDNKVFVKGGIPILKEVMPNAEIKGFTRPSEAVEYAKENRIELAFLDIEMGMISGLDVCKELLEINPNTNVVYLTAYKDYSFDAWQTGACGFMEKPLTPENVREQLTRLRHPFLGGAAE
ncbi:MAG: response regulator [Eubacterium sp.]|nr:response regulator [Eubacterium sp.]